MAEFTGVFNVEQFTREIQEMPIENGIRLQLINCLQSINILELNDVSDTSGANNSLSRLNDVIILLNKFAKAAVDVLEACEVLPFPVGVICKVITEVVGFMFNKDIASVVINRFSAILEADLIAKCRATCTKITHCISYMQGLPPVDRLQPNQRVHNLQLLASDVPIQTGLDEVLFLGEKIRLMVSAADVDKANKLFEYAQLYCCLATYRELFLMYRFAIQSSFSDEAVSVSNVIRAQTANDREILRFLYLPTTQSVRLFRRCFLDQWVILRHFLERRGLETDDLRELCGKTLKIKSVRFNTKSLHSCTFPLFTEQSLHLFDDSNNAAADIEFRAVANNRFVFTIWSRNFQPPRQVYCNSVDQMGISRGEPPVGKSLWYILRVYPQTPNETTCYMIWLAHDHRLCLTALWNTNVCLTSCSKPGRSNFWIIEELPESAV